MDEAGTEPPILSVAQVVPCTEAEGPGRRFAVWFQGCPLRCPGCCNPEFLPFAGGERRTVDELAGWMARARDADGIEGITLLGGEPLAHAAGAAALAAAARDLGLSVMVFSGYTLEQLRGRTDQAAADLLARTDILVDGPYLRGQPDTERRWVGSRNQRIHFLTDRYQYDDRWGRRNTLEIRLTDGELSVNGFPARDAVGLWKGWTRKPLPTAGADAR
ncbi:MAG: radical SAM protein [Gemmataceae bacterium]|nr:radical SAM protein [Gemmataceae bacterium]